MLGFSKIRNGAGKQNTLFHEDYSIKDVNEAIVGRKGESLFYLAGMDVPIPDFFVITPEVYRTFLSGAFRKKLPKLVEKLKEPDINELEKIILNAEFPKDLLNDILHAYTRLSGFSNAWVAVRSSVVYPQDKSVHFSGIFHTELSVKGSDQLIDAIKRVYLSLFKDRVILYSREKGVDLTELQMAVVVQRMVQPEVSGITYTQDPITKDRKKMSIEAVFGLGDVITDGSITPDLYTLEKRDLGFVEKHISPQEWMRIRKPADRKVGYSEPYQKIPITKTWSHQQKLEDNYIKDIAKVSLIVEDKTKSPQIVEWAWESGNVWILQNKALIDQPVASSSPAPTSEVRNVYDIALDIVKDEQQARKQNETMQIADMVLEQDQIDRSPVSESDDAELSSEIEKIEKNVDLISERAIKEEKKLTEKREIKDKKDRAKKGVPESIGAKDMEFLLSGIGVSTGKAIGKIVTVDGKKPETMVLGKNDILLLSNFNQKMELLVINSGGVIMDEGGLTSDISILCRDLEIPAVTGTGLATTILNEGEYVMIDGNVGSVYRYTPPATKESKPVKQKEEKTEQPLIENKKSEASVAPVKPKVKKSKPPSATKVLLHPARGSRPEEYNEYTGYLDGISFVDMDGLMLKEGTHPLAHVADKKFSTYATQLEKILDAFADLDSSDEMIVSIGSGSVAEFRQLKRGKEYEPKDLEDSVFGLQRLVKTPKLLEKQAGVLKNVRNVYNNRNVSLALHSPLNKSMLTTIKKEISSIGLKRSGSFNLYAIIDTTSEVILLSDLLSAGLDGVIINTPSLALQMQGLNRTMVDAKYNIGVNTVWNVVEKMITEINANGLRSYVMVEDNKTLIRNCISKGVYGVCVDPLKGEDLKNYVSDQEAKMIMNL